MAEILTKEGFKCFDSIISSGYSDEAVELVLSNEKTLECTKDHLILKNNSSYELAGSLGVSSLLSNGVFLEDSIVINETIEVFDVVSVEDTNSFTTNGIEVHNCLILDEFAHLASDKLATDFWASNYPAVSASKNAKIIIASTPKGLFNLFGLLWDGAINGRNEFKHYKTIWSDVEGRDEKWKEDQLKNMNNDVTLFNQEFECSFIGSISTVIDPEVLKVISNKYIQPITKDLNGKLAVYEKPIDGCVYVIGADTAKGTGEHYSSTQILKVISLKPIKLKQVAVFNDNMVDVYKYAEILNRLGVYYNGAWIICENNAEGSAVVNQLWWELEYSKLYNCGSKTTDLGVRATKNTKPKAVLLMKKLIEDYSLELVDRDTLEQLNDYSEKNGKFACNNLNDDLVSALYWATYALTLDILDESFEFDKKEEEDDVWGILTDSTDLTDWTWLNTPSII